MKITGHALSILLPLFLTQLTHAATPIASGQFHQVIGYNSLARYSHVSFGFLTWSGDPESDPNMPVYHLIVPQAHVGETFWFTRKDPLARGVLDTFSNGVDDPVTLYCLGGPVGKVESTLFTNRPEGPEIDLRGYYLGAIGFQFDWLRCYSPGSDPNHNGIWTDYDWQISLFVVRAIQPTLELLSSVEVVSTKHLTALLEEAETALAQGNIDKGIKLLHKFQNRVRSLGLDTYITEALIESVQEIIDGAKMEDGN